ncbi:MAG: hypothetical protein LLG93_04320 [Deltaproteobacteria bacterium]|nr:hypothetical protein [Deltaproteobacteria bacterium]
MRTRTRNTTVGLDVILALENAILQADLQMCRSILQEIAVDYGEDVLISQVIEPVLIDLGALLKCQEVSLAQSDQIFMIIDDLLHLYQSTSQSGKSDKKSDPCQARHQDDCHQPCRRIVSTGQR